MMHARIVTKLPDVVFRFTHPSFFRFFCGAKKNLRDNRIIMTRALIIIV